MFPSGGSRQKSGNFYEPVMRPEGSLDGIDSATENASMDSFGSTGGLRQVEAGEVPEVEITTKKELWGWYLFEVCSSGFSGSVLPVFLPLLLVTVATDQAWTYMGRTAPVDCDDTHKVDCLKCFPGSGDRLVDSSGQDHGLPHLSVYFGSVAINPVSYATIALGVSVLFQLFAFISAGPLVDYGDRRKTVLTWGTIFGSVSCMLCLAVYKPELWWLAGVLCIASNVAYGLSYIAYNTYLPLLTESTKEMLDARNSSEMTKQIVRFEVENKISLIAILVGAVLGAVCVVISFAVAFLPGISTELILRIACFIGGVWWLVGYIPPFLWLKRRPRPKFVGKTTPWMGWTEVLALIKESKQHIYAWRFLVIYFIFSDGYTTVNQIGILFAQQQLCMSTPELAAIAIIVNAFAFIGNPLFGYIQRRWRFDNNQMIILCLLWMSVLPVYGIIGYWTPRNSFGLKHASEMFAFSCWYGMSLGPILSYSRTLFIDLIPIGREGAMFSLWSLSSKGSAWVGPFVVAILVEKTNDLRSAFVYTLVVMLVPIFLLWFFIDNRAGLIQCGRLVLEPDTHVLLVDGLEGGQEQTTEKASMNVDDHGSRLKSDLHGLAV